MKQLLASALLLSCLLSLTTCQQFTEEDGVEYIKELDKIFCDAGNAEMVARWNYITNITQFNEVEMVCIYGLFIGEKFVPTLSSTN